MKNIRYLILILFLTFGSPALAAVDDVTFSADTTISDITFNSTVTDMVVFADSTAESITIESGVFTVTNPGDFYVGSSNASVNTIVILKDSVMQSCAVNSDPGTSSTTLPTANGDYEIRPLTNASCSSLCSTLTGAATYNTYPTCGAATCNSGYTRSGSGASATCSANSSGGGGGSFIPTPVTTTETPSQEDITNVVTESNTNQSGEEIAEAITKAIITSNGYTRNNIEVRLNSSQNTKISDAVVIFPATLINSLVQTYGTDNAISAYLKSREADAEQKTATARGGRFLAGYDIISLNLYTGGSEIKTLMAPVTLTFSVAGINNAEILRVYYFDTDLRVWKIAGNGGSYSNGQITVLVNHFTDFGLFEDAPARNNTTSQASSENPRLSQLSQIINEGAVIFNSGKNLEGIIIHNNAQMNVEAQRSAMAKYTEPLIKDLKNVSVSESYAINNFVVYGTLTTRILGAGERAGVVNSYKKAFNKVPRTESEWKDCILIGNGRWPGETSQTAENLGKEKFKKIYLREASMNQANDNAAVTVIAYGLRPANRNMNSEKAAIKNFKGIFKYNPVSALDWDMVRSIAYSGAKR